MLLCESLCALVTHHSTPQRGKPGERNDQKENANPQRLCRTAFRLFSSLRKQCALFVLHDSALRDSRVHSLAGDSVKDLLPGDVEPFIPVSGNRLIQQVNVIFNQFRQSGISLLLSGIVDGEFINCTDLLAQSADDRRCRLQIVPGQRRI